MTLSDKSNTSKSARFQIYPWRYSEFVILLVNGILVLWVAICCGKLVLELLRQSPNSDKTNDLLIAVIMTVTAYIYSIIAAKASVRAFEKQGGITNITQILRFYSFVYYVGFCLVYFIVIIKLAERDYALLSYTLYIVILLVCFTAVRVFATIPKVQDVWILAVLMFVTNLLHAASLVFQYIFQDAGHLWYFLKDLGVLIGMSALAIYTLFGQWKV